MLVAYGKDFFPLTVIAFTSRTCSGGKVRASFCINMFQRRAIPRSIVEAIYCLCTH